MANTPPIANPLPTTFGAKFSTSTTDGAQRVNVEGVSPAFSCSTGLFAPAATPNDVVALSMANYGRVVALRRIEVSGTSTSGGQIYVRLMRSPNGSMGTYSNPTIARNDQNDTAPNGLVWRFTTNRTGDQNTISGSRPLLAEKDITLGIAGTSAGSAAVFDFPDGVKPPTLKQITDWLVINLNGQTLPTGTQIRVTLHWSEQRTARIGAIGDSTTSNATSGYLNGGANAGGMGTSGLMNSLAAIDNFGSNGYRLWDFINNTNGVTYPLSVVSTRNCDVWNLCYGINDVRTGTLGASQADAVNQLTAMLDSVIYSAQNGAVSGAAYVSPKAIAYAISSITWAANVATVTASGPHGFSGASAADVNVSGVLPSGYNNTARITVTSPTTFTYALASNPGAYTSGGVAKFATIWPSTWAAQPDLKIILWGPNCFSSDDGGDGPFYYLSASNNATLSGLWTGMTLAQAAQAASDILYSAYAAFAGDSRIYAMVQKQDGAFGRIVQPVATSGILVNQLHPNARGQALATRQILPMLLTAISAIARDIY